MTIRLSILAAFCVGVMQLPATERPMTTRRYLQGPLSERLLVFFREGKITFGECIHRDDWKSMPYRDQPAHGVWLVRGAADEPFDHAEAVMLGEANGVPVHGQRWRESGLEVTMEACAPFGRKPTVQARLVFENRGTVPLEQQVGLMVRAAPEMKLVFGAPDIYKIYAPPIQDWRAQESTFVDKGNGLLRDENRFVAYVGEASWDGRAGILRMSLALSPGERRVLDFTVGKGEPVRPDFDRTRDAVRSDWEKELVRVADRTPFVQSQVVQLLQCFARPTEGAFVLPRQGGLQRYVWPGETIHVVEALDRLGYVEYARMAVDFLMRFAKEGGQIGPFANNWASETAYTIEAVSRHCRLVDDADCWRRHYPAVLAGFRWIRATRAETAKGGAGLVAGLFPPLKSTDSKKCFQHWGMTDLVNEHALGVLAEAAARFGEREADEIRAEWTDYRSVIGKTLDRWRTASAGKETFFIPLAPDGREEKTFRDNHFFYLHPAAFVEGGYLTADEMLRLRRWLLDEGIADGNGLYMRHTSPYPELRNHVWYTTWCEYQWSVGWRRVGRADLARQALDACLAYSVTDENYVGERVHDRTPWFFPWSPNASGSARILKMLMDAGRDKPLSDNAK